MIKSVKAVGAKAEKVRLESFQSGVVVYSLMM